MKEKIIKFEDAENARLFVANADRCDFDIDVQYNHIILDGKSIMALFSLDFSRPVTVKYTGNNEAFETLLVKLAVDE